MKCLIKHLLVTLLSSVLIGSAISAPTIAVGPDNLCQNVLSWIYKDLTVKNLEKSINRTKKKLLAGVIVTLKNHNQEKLDKHPKLAELWLSMKKLDPSFEKYLKKNKPYRKFVDYGFIDRILGNVNPNDTKIHNFFNVIKQWKDLQASQPDYFAGLPDNLKLDDWDLATSTIVDQIGSLNYNDPTLVESLKDLSKDLKSFAPNAAKEFDGKNKNLSEINNDINKIQRNIMDSIVDIYTKNFDEYKDFCSKADFENLLQNSAETNFCPAEIIEQSPAPAIESNLNLIAKILKDQDLNSTFKPEKPLIIVPDPPPVVSPMDQLCLVKIDYFKSKKPAKNETFNMRTDDIVDTVVIHHTGDYTNFETSAESIHKTHVNKWYMIGYNYLISFGGNGATIEKPRVIQGRDPSYKGAHAGGETLPLSPKTINSFYENIQGYHCEEDLSSITTESSKIQTQTTCDETPNDERRKNPTCASFSTSIADVERDGTVNGNLTSIGIALLGNFDTKHRRTFLNENLYDSKKVHISKVKDQAVEKLVTLINALKTQFPNLKKIVPHSYFRPTRCPGSVAEILQEVAQQTGLNFFSSKAEEFDRYKTTKYKHLRKVNGKYVYKNKYSNFIKVMNSIRYQENTIIYIRKERQQRNLSENYRESEIKKAQVKLVKLYNKKDLLSLEVEL
jgi:hypothetical protein